MTSHPVRVVSVILAAVLALLLAGCGTRVLVVIPKGAETVIRNVVGRQTGLQASDVICPSNVHAKAGNTFVCHFSAGGKKYIAHMSIVRVKAPAVYYEVTTSLA